MAIYYLIPITHLGGRGKEEGVWNGIRTQCLEYKTSGKKHQRLINIQST